MGKYWMRHRRIFTMAANTTATRYESPTTDVICDIDGGKLEIYNHSDNVKTLIDTWNLYKPNGGECAIATFDFDKYRFYDYTGHLQNSIGKPDDICNGVQKKLNGEIRFTYFAQPYNICSNNDSYIKCCEERPIGHNITSLSVVDKNGKQEEWFPTVDIKHPKCSSLMAHADNEALLFYSCKVSGIKSHHIAAKLTSSETK